MAYRRASSRPQALLRSLLCSSLSMLPVHVWGHTAGGDAAPAAGVTIPTLTHGQMSVIADHRRDILELAARRIDTGEGFRRVLNHANVQHGACLWGLVPGAIRDETSPFNECSHAYLAATKDILARMRAAHDESAAVRALVARVDRDMLRDSTSLELCRYSAETFDTARVVWPRWRRVPVHLKSATSLGGAALGFFGLAFAIGRAVTRPSA